MEREENWEVAHGDVLSMAPATSFHPNRSCISASSAAIRSYLETVDISLAPCIPGQAKSKDFQLTLPTTILTEKKPTSPTTKHTVPKNPLRVCSSLSQPSSRCHPTFSFCSSPKEHDPKETDAVCRLKSFGSEHQPSTFLSQTASCRIRTRYWYRT
jgi:hypothetical protein